jgi:hypothetical protein
MSHQWFFGGTSFPCVLHNPKLRARRGGFEFGSDLAINGTVVVERSVALGEPIIWVAVNYR